MWRSRAAISAAALIVALPLLMTAAPRETITIWRVGSPHEGDTPATTAPAGITRRAAAAGFRISVEAFPAEGFADRFFEAAARNAAPDVLVFDNFGVISGITTALGRFEGIGRNGAIRPHLIKVTESFDDLLGPKRGWTYLFTLSPHYDAARALALQRCPDNTLASDARGDVSAVAPMFAIAYVEGSGLQMYSDPDRLVTQAVGRETTKVAATQVCSASGNERLAFVSVTASYSAETAIGHARMLLVLRRGPSGWRVLVAARDPQSNERFAKDVPRLVSGLMPESNVLALPTPATLLSPPDGEYPRPSRGQRFGAFTWRSSADEVVAEVAEFAYDDDARLFMTWPVRAVQPAIGTISAGQLWTTHDRWYWRVWSVDRTGGIAFSETRTFTH